MKERKLKDLSPKYVDKEKHFRNFVPEILSLGIFNLNHSNCYLLSAISVLSAYWLWTANCINLDYCCYAVT